MAMPAGCDIIAIRPSGLPVEDENLGAASAVGGPATRLKATSAAANDNGRPGGTDVLSWWTTFDAVHPKILGGLLDALVGALANVDQVRLDRLPRMADFATWITAAEQSLGWEPGAFMTSYTGNRNESHEIAIESSPIGVPLQTIAEDGFNGTFTQLLERLNEQVEEKARPKEDWPKSARGLSSDIQRIAPNLRRVGYTVEVQLVMSVAA
jgi:hypothetical protein